MKFEDIPKVIKELRGLIRDFVKKPFPATKALVILAIFVVTIITQVAGYTLKVPYQWLFVGLVIIVIILLITLRMAYRFDQQES